MGRLGGTSTRRGLDVVELGCGTAYFSARLAKRGARTVFVDPTPAQLATARRLEAETGITFLLVEAPGERVPLPDGSFDLAFSEYGASLWADPHRWVPEAARLLRPDGRLVFLTNSTIAFLCTPDVGEVGERLMRPQTAMYRVEWPDEVGVEYHLSHPQWIDLLHGSGFQVERLIDVYAGPESVRHDVYGYVSPGWARQLPVEEMSRRSGPRATEPESAQPPGRPRPWPPDRGTGYRSLPIRTCPRDPRRSSSAIQAANTRPIASP